jgi:hypothetical protein
MSGRGVPQLSVGSSEASLPGPSPTARAFPSGIGRHQLRVGRDRPLDSRSRSRRPGPFVLLRQRRPLAAPQHGIEFRLKWCATGGGAPVAQSWARG